MFGGVMLVVFIIWIFITIFGLYISGNFMVFLQSPGFVIIAIGYVVIIAAYSILKRFFRGDQYEYY